MGLQERVVEIVEHNTANEMQGPLLSERALRTIANHAGLGESAVNQGVTAAFEAGELVEVEHDGQTYVCPPREKPIEDAIIAEVESRSLDNDAIARYNTAMQAIREAA
jgi:hypothetical protein